MRQRKGFDPTLIVVFVLIMLGLIGLLIGLLMQPGDGGGEAPNGSPVTENGGDDQPPGDGNGSTVVKPPDPGTGTPRSLSGAPRLRLYPVERTAVRWARLPSPVEPMIPASFTNTTLLHVSIQPATNGEGGVMRATFVADNPLVYETAVLHVQLLDAQGRAYAELKRAIPAPNGRQGLVLSMPVASSYLDAYESARAEITPINPISDGVPLEPLPQRSAVMNPDALQPVILLAVRNPSNRAVVRPRLIVEALATDGHHLGTFETRGEQRLGPGEIYQFEVSPPLETGERIGRVEVRGYAIEAGSG